MIVSKTKDIVLFCTHFSEDFDLIQKLSGTTPIKAYYNTPVDFRESGLKYKSKSDIWHIDVPFAYSTDEAPALMVNRKWLGENHIFPFAVALHIPDHGKTYGDIGSLWEDAEGTKWTLTNVDTEVVTLIDSEVDVIGEISSETLVVVSFSEMLSILDECGIELSRFVPHPESNKARIKDQNICIFLMIFPPHNIL
jgi:hypothetical protein